MLNILQLQHITSLIRFVSALEHCPQFSRIVDFSIRLCILRSYTLMIINFTFI